MNTAEQQRDWLLEQLNNIMVNGIFPKVRLAAYSLLKDYAAQHEQENKSD